MKRELTKLEGKTFSSYGSDLVDVYECKYCGFRYKKKYKECPNCSDKIKIISVDVANSDESWLRQNKMRVKRKI